jgi:RNA polymerase sigma-70 factor (ECF subfamily)
MRGLMPEDGEVAGLLALMLLTESRHTWSRVSTSASRTSLNRAIAIAELDGPEVALAAIDRLWDRLADYHSFHATRADLLRRLGRSRESRAAYDKAIELAGNTAETAYLTRRRDELA